jgi:pterin-4a-carbinolamine dehydratase
VTLTYATHSEAGITEKDIAGAREADRLSSG